MVWLRNSKVRDSRTFINIIHGKSNKLANWEPSCAIALGDYGTLDRNSGEFHKDGNIFKDPKFKNIDGLHTSQGAPDEKYTITSFDAAELEFHTTLDMETLGLPADAGIKARFKFTHRHGAMLLMSQPVTSKLENLNQLLCTENNDRLRKKHLVAEIVTCSAYAMYLSAKSSETISVALRASVPTGTVPVVAEAGGSWHHSGGVGVFRCGSQPGQSFTTLYSTVEIVKNRIKRRDFPRRPADPETLDKDCWRDSLLPWKPLNPEGEEEDGDELVQQDKDDSDSDDDW